MLGTDSLPRPHPATRCPAGARLRLAAAHARRGEMPRCPPPSPRRARVRPRARGAAAPWCVAYEPELPYEDHQRAVESEDHQGRGPPHTRIIEYEDHRLDDRVRGPSRTRAIESEDHEVRGPPHHQGPGRGRLAAPRRGPRWGVWRLAGARRRPRRPLGRWARRRARRSSAALGGATVGQGGALRLSAARLNARPGCPSPPPRRHRRVRGPHHPPLPAARGWRHAVTTGVTASRPPLS